MARYGDIVRERDEARAALARIINEAKARIEALTAQNRALKARNEALRAEAERLGVAQLAATHGDAQAPGVFEPGASPLSDLPAWRRSQLGL